VFRDFVTAAFASLPKDAIVVTMGDHVRARFFYFHEVEKLRPDVTTSTSSCWAPVGTATVRAAATLIW